MNQEQLMLYAKCSWRSKARLGSLKLMVTLKTVKLTIKEKIELPILKTKCVESHYYSVIKMLNRPFFDISFLVCLFALSFPVS